MEITEAQLEDFYRSAINLINGNLENCGEYGIENRLPVYMRAKGMHETLELAAEKLGLPMVFKGSGIGSVASWRDLQCRAGVSIEEVYPRHIFPCVRLQCPQRPLSDEDTSHRSQNPHSENKSELEIHHCQE